ncbi:Lethal(3)malignant brain tumor-like protein 3 [Willisornis vidua]|uniref:Lethal(3)malignant brain tumor-like protein 3 n=1 Tax=Willisornis vidua TaxID=1566151 RepID=A0ABQ9CWN5_9PASS|nr:Lethal(3)malignant brain tumor-like protein 3 [Willisornis vidua]
MLTVPAALDHICQDYSRDGERENLGGTCIMNESASSGNGQEFDVFSAMDWKDGIGTLPGSDLKLLQDYPITVLLKHLKTNAILVELPDCLADNIIPMRFRVNEFGALEVITDETEMESVKKATATTTWMVPTAQEAFSEKTGIPTRLKETTKVDGLVFCENCYCYGTIEEFVSEGKFCSQKCAQQVKNKEPKEENPIMECNGEDDSKGIRKRKAKLPLKEEPRDNGERKENTDEMYQSFPYNKNGFKVGMKLEGVDPEHQSIYCVLTVAEVCGYRIRLHFDGYPDCYDFWVNADSSDIHPVGWCEKTGHKLHPPKGYKEEEFSWPSYLKACKAQAAPKSLFENQNATVIPSGFRVGMKLEAVDKKNPTFICVATVTDMVDNRFLVHFDNWDESYDYWYDAFVLNSLFEEVMLCLKEDKTILKNRKVERIPVIVLPNDGDIDFRVGLNRNWIKPSHGFQKNMKLEVVDKRNPVFIRVATIVDTDDYRIKVHFDGWDNIYDYWTDVDSPDIHPAGWCAKTGHPLQPPLSPLELVEALEHGGCPIAGCKGVGLIKRARHIGHHSDRKCPSPGHVGMKSSAHNRLSGKTGPETTKLEDAESRSPCKKPLLCNVKEKKAPGGVLQTKGTIKNKECEDEETENNLLISNEIKDVEEPSTQRLLSQPVIVSSKLQIPGLPLRWEQQSKLLPSVAGIPASKVSKWSTDEVSEFIRSLPGCEEHGKVFKDEQIDGEAFLLMTQSDIVKIMSIKLGPALKIFNSILMFKAAEKNSHNEL